MTGWIAPLLAQGAQEEEEGFHAPEIGEFFPAPIFFDGTIFHFTRIHLVMVVMTLLTSAFFIAAFRKPQIVPRGVQNLGELAIEFVRVQIIDEVIGSAGRRFLPYLTTLFWFVFALNIAGIIPFLNISGSSVIGLPLMLALISWLMFNYEGIREQGVGPYLRGNLFPPGVPAPIYVLVTPIEFVSTFILRPVTLTIRLLANMLAGHLLLVLFFSATSYLLLDASGPLKIFSVASFGMGFIFTLFEILVAFLQAYIFALLTAVYIGGALAPDH
jgi:F-type H+-transporting ATPase subunit a